MDVNFATIRDQARLGDTAFWETLAKLTRQADSVDDLLRLAVLRKRAEASGLPRPRPAREKVRVAFLGAYTLSPLDQLLIHLLDVEESPCELFIGDFDNYHAEIMDERSALYDFRPQFVIVFPSAVRCQYDGSLLDDRKLQEQQARHLVDELLGLCRVVHQRSDAQVILANFMLPARHDLGAYRSRTLGSSWSFRKWVNLELGLCAPSFVRICDLEFLAARQGNVMAVDERAWFESKQPCAPALLPVIARELAHLLRAAHRPPKKVLVLDLDNTLWGGVVADDGLDGIEIGDTSPRGEAFKAFQRHVKSLKERGVLLAVCSKNDTERAAEPFEKHPEMVLRLTDFVSFKASWEPKSDSIRSMALELGLGLNSFVFVDDNPAEIDIVRQYAPEVTTIWLGPDPAGYANQVADSRLFEPSTLTAEDIKRTDSYRTDGERNHLLASATDMDSYLRSLEMEGAFTEFNVLDVPRLVQLIERSNQFNLTTRRRNEAQILGLMNDPNVVAFSMRLSDRFGDHGLISIVIGIQTGEVLEIDTWLMSCRVLKRQVEDAVLYEVVRLARERKCSEIQGVYLPTAKNSMVSDFYARMGFAPVRADATSARYALSLEHLGPKTTAIKIIRHAHQPT